MKQKIWILLTIGLLLAACSGSAGSQGTSSTMEIKDAWARPVAVMQMEDNSSNGDMSGDQMNGSNGAAYFTIVNKDSTADRLISAESDVANAVEIHETTMKDNVMSMSPVEAIEVPPNGQVELKPGGYHIMMVGLKQDLNVGDSVTLTLVFEKAGRITVDVAVKNP
jgi:copper(I)-binding protein